MSPTLCISIPLFDPRSLGIGNLGVNQNCLGTCGQNSRAEMALSVSQFRQDSMLITRWSVRWSEVVSGMSGLTKCVSLGLSL